jgi:uncharacterized protein
MDVTSSALLERRLQRLRAGTGQGEAVVPRPPPSQRVQATEAAGAARARTLAADLGEGATLAGDGRVVVVETTIALPLEPAALGGLPWPVDVDRPLICLDLETTGLGTAAGTVPFLVGLGRWDGPWLTVSQLLLPDHADEPALLSVLQGMLPADAWLVTYNGRTFDWPLLVSRYRLHRRAPPSIAGHLDMLPVARQLWKHRLGNARLATVERLAGVQRGEDLPGALVPERYFRYLRERRAEPLRDVLSHNTQDVVSLGLLLSLLAERFGRSDGWPDTDPGDLAGLARGYSRLGRAAEALACLEVALTALDTTPAHDGAAARSALHGRIAAERARLLARLGRREEAAVAWLAVARRGGPGAATAWIHVARYREHLARDADAALEACEQAARLAHRARAFGRPMLSIEHDLRRRLPRLRRRQLAGWISPRDPHRRAA